MPAPDDLHLTMDSVLSLRPNQRLQLTGQGSDKKGQGHALLTHALREERAHGVEVIWLHTIVEYPTGAVDLNRCLAFQVIKEFQRYCKTSTKLWN
jgi:hypothetical protein